MFRSIMNRKHLIVIPILLLLNGSSFAQNQDNVEIHKMYEEDQGQRMVLNIDWVQLNKNDSIRSKRIYELLDSGKVITGKDYYHSAMIFQHGKDTTASAMAVKLIQKSLSLDSTVNKWLYAAAIDRDLMRKKRPQIYGTQYVRNKANGKLERYQIDSTQITDAQRKYYYVETLAEQKIKTRAMNLISLPQLYAQEQSLDKTLAFIKAEKQKGSTSLYDVSEVSINTFGYSLIKTPEDALKIFELNTTLYPEGFKNFDSYGACLLLLNRKEEAKKAYKKSLELNPRNGNAQQKLKEM